MKKKKIWIISVISILVVLLVGTTYSLLVSYLPDQTNIDITVNDLGIVYNKGVDIQGEIPVALDYTGASSFEIELWKTLDIDVYGNIYVNLSSLSEVFTKSKVIKWELWSNGVKLAGDSFKCASIDTDLSLYQNFLLQNEKQIFTIYIWADYNLVNSSMSSSSLTGAIKAEASQNPFTADDLACSIEEDIPESPAILLSDYTLSWEAIGDASSYEVYSNDTLLTSTTSNNVDLYTYYDTAGTYDVTVKAVNENGIKSENSNSVSYSIEQLIPQKILGINYSHATTTLDTLFTELPSTNYYYIYIWECDSVDSTGSSVNSTNITEINLDSRATLINVCMDTPKENAYTYDFEETDCYSGPIEEFSKTVADSSAGGTTQLYYDTTEKGLHIIQNPTGTTNMIFKFTLGAPGYIDSEVIYGQIQHICLSGDMEVIVYDKKKKKRKKKKIKDVTYDDLLLVWDFDKGCFAWAKPLWIKKKQTTNQYNLLKFSDGSILKTIQQHRIFNKEKGKFTYPMTEDTPLGTTTFHADGKEVTLVSKEVINEEVDFYNVITEYHMNLFANNILTSCRLSNLYEIKDMKYIKDNRKLHTIEELDIKQKWFDGLRLSEQNLDINRDNSVNHGDTLKEYIENLEKLDIHNQ